MENGFVRKKKKRKKAKISRSRFSIRFSFFFFFFFFPLSSLLTVEKPVSRANRLTNFSISLRATVTPHLTRSLWSELGSDTVASRFFHQLRIACVARISASFLRRVFSSCSASFAPLFRTSSCLLDPHICTRNLETPATPSPNASQQFNLWRPPISTFHYSF